MLLRGYFPTVGTLLTCEHQIDTGETTINIQFNQKLE